MESKDTSDGHACSACGKDASLVCKACEGTPDIAGRITAVYYCSVTCQETDWLTHKPKCKASNNRQVLLRAGDVLQLLILLFFKQTWCSVIDKVVIGHQSIFVGGYFTGEVWNLYHGNRTASMQEYFLPFPPENLLKVPDDDALLTNGACRTALYLVHHLLSDMLKDMDAQTREVCIQIKKQRRTLINHEAQSSGHSKSIPTRHNVFQITLSNGESFALDLTAAQYGWKGPATIPWSVFQEERVEGILENLQRGGTEQQLADETRGDNTDRQIHYSAIQIMRKGFYEGLIEWQRQHRSIGALLRLPEADFCNELKSLLDFMDTVLGLWKNEVNHMGRSLQF